jgi:predicted metal-dependent hydrolase
MKGTVEKKHFRLADGRVVPLRVYREMRGGFRIAVGRDAVNVRLPIVLDDNGERDAANFIEENLEKWFSKNPQLLERFESKKYENGGQFQVGERQYFLEIGENLERKSHGAQLLQGRVIAFDLAASDSESSKQKAISTLLSRIIAADFLPELTRRVLEINEIFFKKYNKTIKSVRLKNNASNWGSCSSTGNINFSTRLLFAPADVIDYVIIHELAHLIELNHSNRFWKLVEDAMPDYREKERWLAKNSANMKY